MLWLKALIKNQINLDHKGTSIPSTDFLAKLQRKGVFQGILLLTQEEKAALTSAAHLCHSQIRHSHDAGSKGSHHRSHTVPRGPPHFPGQNRGGG